MGNFDIGLSGIMVAQQAIELIGTNVANTGTEGYHRQDLRISPREFGVSAGFVAGGAEVAGIFRSIDFMIEAEYTRQQPQLAQISQELGALQTLESALGTLSSSGLVASLADFFGSLRDLAGQPNSLPMQEQAAWSAQAMTSQFHQLGEFVLGLEDHLVHEAATTVQQANDLIDMIAALNGQIRETLRSGGNANLLMDRRDQAVNDLSELIDTDVKRVDADGMVNVAAWGSPLITGSNSIGLEVATVADRYLGVSVLRANHYHTDWRGGKLGGILALKNDIVSDIKTKLDALASQIASSINAHHFQGIGQAGSFTYLTGVPSPATAVSDWDADITAGNFYVRITNLETGKVVRRAVAVASSDALSDIAAKIDGLTDADSTAALTASVASNKLRIQVNDTSKFRYDFLPTPMPEFGALWSGGNTSMPAITGTYSGASNQEYTVTVVGGGEVGIDTGLTVEVRNGASELVTTLNVGNGYAAGDVLTMDNGMSIAFSTGTLAAADSFTVQGYATTDETGLLAAAGMNTLFSGETALTLAVRQDILDDTKRFATSLNTTGSDNLNVLRMQDVSETSYAALDDATPEDALRSVVTQVGQDISMREARALSLETVSQQLLNQRNRMSGVDVNRETAMLLVFQQQFQAAAKFMSVQTKVMDVVLELL